MGIAIKRRGEGVRPDPRYFRIGLVLLSEEHRFILKQDGPRLALLWLAVHREWPTVDGLRPVVEAQASTQLGIDTTYLALLTFRVLNGQVELIVAARSGDHRAAQQALSNTRVLTIDEVRSLGQPVEAFDYLEDAYRWSVAASGAIRPAHAIQSAFDRSIDFLKRNFKKERNYNKEDDLAGWNQYQDDDGIGCLSTAQGLLCQIHAGHRSDTTSQAAETLIALQNEDGGWPVRRALLGERSTVSVTESTCYCLWALYEAGYSTAEPVMEQAISWLKQAQNTNGGWPSSPGSRTSNVCATAGAVHVLAKFGRTAEVANGTNWLRRAQCADGGWGREWASNSSTAGFSSPAYTALSVIALLTAGAAATDPAIVRGCAYLENTFGDSEEEPWKSTLYSTYIQPGTSARLSFRLFATPWALAALVLAGRDLGEPRILLGMERLVALQEPGGAWRNDQTPSDVYPMWAIHDALFALRTFVDAGSRMLSTSILANYRGAEAKLFEHLLAQLLCTTSPDRHRPSWRRRLHTGWTFVLTVVVASMALVQFGLLERIQAASLLQRSLTGAVVAIVAVGSVVVPAVIIEEYKIRRRLPRSDATARDASA